MTSHRAFALPLVIWGVLIVSAAVVATGIVVRGHLSDASLGARASRARELAISGASLGTHPGIKRYDPILSQEMAPGEKYTAAILSEGARLNVNAAAKRSDLTPLRDVFIAWGVDQAAATSTAAALADWVDADDTIRPGGAESAAYTSSGKDGLPMNRAFASVEEMSVVEGMDQVAAARPDWREFFTVHGPDLVDLNEVGSDLLSALGGISLTEAAALVQTRDGADGLTGTSDDQTFASVSAAAEVMGLTETQANRLSGNFGTGSDVLRIESRGEVAGFVKKIVVIVRKSKDTRTAPTQMAWQEF